jgi:hypothetical protein
VLEVDAVARTDLYDSPADSRQQLAPQLTLAVAAVAAAEAVKEAREQWILDVLRHLLNATGVAGSEARQRHDGAMTSSSA